MPNAAFSGFYAAMLVKFYIRTKSHFFFRSLKAIPAIAITIGVATSIIFLILWDLLEAQEGQKSISFF